MIRHFIAIAAVACFSASPLLAQEDEAPPSQEERQQAMSSPQAFADRASSSNAFELASSELALEKSTSAEIRSFAEKMIADHTAAAERMQAAANEDGISLSADVMPDHQAQLDALASIDANEFDAAYMGAQLAAHTAAVTLFEGFVQHGENSKLKTLAEELLPKLQEHLDEVTKLSPL